MTQILSRQQVDVDLFRFLDTDGDGTGTKEATGNYALAEEEFYIQPPDGESYFISRLIIEIKDAGSIDAGSYGNGITLTNGIQVQKKDGSGVIVDFTDGEPIITNADWAKFCYDVKTSEFGSGNNYVNVRWTFSKATGGLKGGVFLDGSNNERFTVILNDNFSNLTGHTFMVQGYKI